MDSESERGECWAGRLSPKADVPGIKRTTEPGRQLPDKKAPYPAFEMEDRRMQIRCGTDSTGGRSWRTLTQKATRRKATQRGLAKRFQKAERCLVSKEVCWTVGNWGRYLQATESRHANSCACAYLRPVVVRQVRSSQPQGAAGYSLFAGV